MKNILLATLIALAIPSAVRAQNVEDYQNSQISCQTEACQDLTTSGEEPSVEGAEVSQTRRTRTRRTRSSSIEPFKTWYAGAGAGIFFGENLDLGFQGHVFGGTRFNEFIATDLEFTFGFAGIEDVDENVTLLGFYLNPRFEYKFPRSSITGFLSPGFGFARASVDGNSDTEFDFQIKIGAAFDINEKLDAYAQGRFQSEAEAFGIEGGVLFDL